MADRWWYSTTEAAQRLQLSRRVVLHMIEEGQLPAYRLTERGHWHIRRDAVERLVAEWRTEAS